MVPSESGSYANYPVRADGGREGPVPLARALVLGRASAA